MKKIFEIFLVLIIFYGIYSFFDGAADYIFKELETVWVVLVSLAVSALVLFLYRLMIHSEVKMKMNKNINDLKSEIRNKEDIILEKEEEVKKAKTFKEDLIAEAESSEKVE